MRVPLADLARQQVEIEDAVADGIADVIAEAAFIQSPAVAAFEKEYADFCGVAHCVGVGSGTDAIELSIRALGLGPGRSSHRPCQQLHRQCLGRHAGGSRSGAGRL